MLRFIKLRQHWRAAIALAVLPLVLAAAPAASQHPISFDQGLLWKIVGPTGKSSYVFGTIHSDDPRVTQIPAPVQNALDVSSTFTMEMIAGGDAFLEMADRMFFKDGRTLPDVLGASLYAKTQSALRQRGLPTGDIERKKPWAVVMMLSAPKPKTGLFLDLALQMQATLNGKKIYGLETIGEQLAVFDELSMEDQIALLEGTLSMQDRFDRQLEAMINAYLARDLSRLMTLATEHETNVSEIHDKLMQRLLFQRNYRMVDRMAPRLKEGSAFIAVGSAHLPGNEGVLTLLAARGYQISRVY